LLAYAPETHASTNSATRAIFQSDEDTNFLYSPKALIHRKNSLFRFIIALSYLYPV